MPRRPEREDSGRLTGPHSHGCGLPGAGLARARTLAGAGGHGAGGDGAEQDGRGERGPGDGEGDETVMARRWELVIGSITVCFFPTNRISIYRQFCDPSFPAFRRFHYTKLYSYS